MTITIFNFCPASCYSLLTGFTPSLQYDLLQSIFPSKQSDPIKTCCSKLSIACACPYNKLQTLEQCTQGLHYCPHCHLQQLPSADLTEVPSSFLPPCQGHSSPRGSLTPLFLKLLHMKCLFCVFI